MNREEWRVYNRNKQKYYRNLRRGKPARPYNKSDDIMKSEGHCGCCGMLVSSDYHQRHPLVGCLKWAEKHSEVPPFIREA